MRNPAGKWLRMRRLILSASASKMSISPASSVFAPLFAVEQAATTTGTWMLAKMSGATIVPFVPRRKPNGMGYELISLTPERTPPLASAEVTAAWMNQIIEQCILMAPEQYMWLHRRFKTRPEGVPPRY